MIKAVLFDIDGVIVYSDKANREFVNAILREQGKKNLTEKEFQKIKFFTIKQVLEKYLPELTEKKIEKIRNKWSPKYVNFVSLTELNKGIKEILNYLKKKYKLGIITNRSLTTVLDFHKVKNYFDFIVTSADVKNPKPSPEGINKTLKKFRIKPEEAVFIGDTIADLNAGKSAKVKTLIFRTTQKEIKEKIERITEFEEIKKFL